MSAIDHAVRIDSRLNLQDIVDQLAEILGRPVALESTDAGIHLSSRRSPDSRTRPEARELDAGDDLAHSLRIDVAPGLEPIGYLRTPVVGYPPLTRAQYEAMDSTAALARRLLVNGPSAAFRSEREAVTAELLSENADRRRTAYATALGRRWLQRGEGTVVRALLVDNAATAVDSLAFGRFLSSLRPLPLFYISERPGFLFVAGPPVDSSVDHTIIDEGRRRGIRILGIGTATPDRRAEELGPAAEQAALAAEVAASFAEFQPSTDVSRLGGWVLLRGANLDPSWLAAISPAAAMLTDHGDETQRRTIETYLDAGGQVTAACAALFIHRTTLYYRLEKMPEVVRDALADGMQRSTLHLALKLVRLWEASGRI